MEHEAAGEEGSPGAMHVRALHIKKRALKNKSISVSFNEKDLKDYVTGFHKRKKKRRKEAVENQEAAVTAESALSCGRRCGFYACEASCKAQKIERESVYGIAPESATNDAGFDEEQDDDHDTELVPSVSGMTMYDNGDMQVTVKTSDITREEELPIARPDSGLVPQSVEGIDKTKQKIPVIKRKTNNKNVKKRSRPKPQSKRDKRKGKTENKRQQ